MSVNEREMVDRIAARQMGVEPQQAQQAEMAAAEQAAAQQQAAEQQGRQSQQAAQQRQNQQPTNQDAGKDSDEDKATEKGGPETEGDRMGADAIIYEVEFGEGNKRQLTPQQIKSTFERYSSLNHKQAQYKPVLDVVEQVMRDNPGVNSKQIADYMKSVMKAQKSNPTMGNTQDNQSQSPDGQGHQNSQNGQGQQKDLETMLKDWEEENAASLPPGYKEMVMNGQQGMAQMQQQLQATQQMLRQVMAQSQGVADAAKEGVQQGQEQQVDAVRQQIGNNIDRVQQALELPDEKAEDFMVFAAERGFTLEDFVDPQLTLKVMTDFKNNMDSPEMERMRQIAQRRQAYTGSLGSTPSATPGAEAGMQDQPSRVDQMAERIMAQRGMS